MIATLGQPSQRLFDVSRRLRSCRTHFSRSAKAIRRQVRRASWDTYCERAAAPNLTPCSHNPAMQVYELLDQRQANTRSFETASARSFHAVETLEEVWQLVHWNARAGVAHFQVDRLAGVSQRDFDFAVERKLESIREQVEEDLFPHLSIDVDRIRKRRTVNDQFHSGLLN